MEIEIRLFATLREAVGQKTLTNDYADGTRICDVLNDLVASYPDLEIYDDTGDLHPHVNVLVNGRNTNQLDGLDTPLSDGDSISLFPPVEGGTTHHPTHPAPRLTPVDLPREL